MFQPGRGLAICNLLNEQFQGRIFGRKPSLLMPPFARWSSQPTRDLRCWGYGSLRPVAHFAWVMLEKSVAQSARLCMITHFIACLCRIHHHSFLKSANN